MATEPPCQCTTEALEGLRAIVSRAFGIEDGYKELNGAITKAAGFDMFDRIGMPDSPMALVVAQCAKHIEADGRGALCLDALFVAYPGNFELRDWVRANCPSLMAKVPDATFEAARPAYETGRQKRRVGVISTNLVAVGGAVALSGPQKALSRQMIDRLEDLGGYKAIHDVLHNLQMTVLVELDRIAGPTIDSEDRRSSMINQVQALELAQDNITRLEGDYAALASADGVCAAVHSALDKQLATLAAADTALAKTARRAFMELRRMLARQMDWFDNRLVEASKAIPFADFSQMLRDLAEVGAAPGLTDDKVAQLLTISEALDDTSFRLTRRRELHQLWQRMDTILLNVEDLLAGAGRADELTIHWEDINALVGELDAKGPDHAMSDIKQLAAPIDTAATTEFVDISDALKRKFNFFIRAVRLRFQRADNALLKDCQELKRLRAPLEALGEN